MDIPIDSNKMIESDLSEVAKLKAKRLEMEELLKQKGQSVMSGSPEIAGKETLTHKRWKDGMDTLAKLLQETQQELVASQKKNKTLDISIRYLQNRLMQNGLNSDVELEEEDIFIPGPSKEIMDSLVKENSRLRSITRNLGDPDEVQHLRQNLQYNLDMVENLRMENTGLQKKKDEVISELEMKIERLVEENKEQQFLQTTLNEESASLRKQLSAVAVTCQQMAQKMEANAKKEREVSNKTPTHPFESGIQNSAEAVRILEENKRLKAEVDNLHVMNQRWKIYNDQREEFVHKLQVELQAAKAGQMEEETKKKFEGILIASRQKLEGTVAEKLQLEAQLKGLDEEMKTLQEAFSAQGEELRRSSQQLNHLSAHGTPSGHDIDALKAQIQICTEDFESERKDREKAQDRLSQAEQDNQNLRRQINQLQKEVQHYASLANTPARSQFQSMNIVPSNSSKQPNYLYGRENTMYNAGPEMRLNARGGRSPQPRIGNMLGSDVPDDLNSVTEDSEPAALVSRGKREEKKRPSTPQRKLIDEMGLLQCPKCRKEYEAHQHNELLEHIDICC